MNTYEITVHCTDGDWVSRRLPCEDFHAAATAGLDWINMASINPSHKLHGARLLRIERMPEHTVMPTVHPR